MLLSLHEGSTPSSPPWFHCMPILCGGYWGITSHVKQKQVQITGTVLIVTLSLTLLYIMEAGVGYTIQ